jgi:hypothetical protein
MSVLKNITIKPEGFPETEVWVAVLQTAVFFNSLNPMYDRFYYKNGDEQNGNKSVTPGSTWSPKYDLEVWY